MSLLVAGILYGACAGISFGMYKYHLKQEGGGEMDKYLEMGAMAKPLTAENSDDES